MADVTTQRIAQGASAAPAAGRGPAFDFATLLGVIGAFALILAAMNLGGRVEAFLDLPSLLIVLGGTLFVTITSYGFSDLMRSQSVLWRTLVYHAEEPQNAARRVIALAAEARKSGPLALQRTVGSLRSTPFLRQAIALVVDGQPSDQVSGLLDSEIGATAVRHQRAAAVFRRAGEVAPAMGLIGTLVGLVQMLGRLDDPSAIGPAMAVALLTTFYGAVLAHMVFLPLAHKLERNADKEHAVNRIYALGAASISRQENPRRLEQLLNCLLAPSQRLRTFD